MALSIRIASWNINSVRARAGLIETFLRSESPDILCLQETKVVDCDFPVGLFAALGYEHVILCGQRMHHGVAILSRLPMREDDRFDWQANGEARHVGVRLDCGIRVENVYVPAGGDVPDRAQNPKFGQKLDFIDRMTRWSEACRCPTVLVGDFNVAPLECDVWSHKQLINVVSHTPVEVEALTRLQQSNDWVDLGRHFHPAPKRLHTWWSYRSPDWTKNDRGRRLDHMWATPDVAALAVEHHVHEPCRGWARPSDHVPLVTEFRIWSGGQPDAVARALDALRRGRPVDISGTLVLAVETADEDALGAFDSAGASDLLISGHRAAILKLANQRDAVPAGPVRIVRTSWLDLAAARAVADPALDLANPLKGPFRTAPVEKREAAEAALILARLAGLLPALFVGGSAEAPASVSHEAVRAAARSEHLRIVARAKLPNRWSEQAEIVAFRAASDGAEHVALLFGEPAGEPPVVRLHSECLTGDVFGSLKCDCGPQLDDALAAISASGWGILLYLRQEGRGIGLANKLRAYALQDQGFDTVDANLRIGFGDDERDYAVAARMLEALKQERVRLLTNNPRKMAGLEAEGIEVIDRVPLKAGANPHNEAYLDSKRLRSGHRL